VPAPRLQGGSPWTKREEVAEGEAHLGPEGVEGAGPDVRRQHDVVERRQGMARGKGLRGEHVEPRPGDEPRAERLHQRLLVDDASAGDVDQVRRGLHPLQEVAVHHVPGFRRKRHVAHDDVGLAEEPVAVDQLHAVPGPLLRRQGDVGVVGDQPDVEAAGPLGGGPARPPEADEAQRLPLQVARPGAEPPLEPAPLDERVVGHHHLLEEGEDQGQGVLADPG
jgi:hypothetical protein